MATASGRNTKKRPRTEDAVTRNQQQVALEESQIVVDELRGQVARMQRREEEREREVLQLRNQVQQLTMMRAEEERQRRLGAQNWQHEPTGFNNHNHNVNNVVIQNNNVLLQSMLEHFQGMKIQVELPIFNGDAKNNPLEYLDSLEKYFLKKRVSDEQKILCVEESLKDRALVWFYSRSRP